MPVFRSGKGNTPAWCELKDFEIIELANNETRTFSRSAEKEEIIICSGLVKAAYGAISCQLPEGAKMDLNSASAETYVIEALSEKSLVFHAAGNWKSITSSGLFTVRTNTPPDYDTPYDYKKTTGFDNHYHDCDEYWFILEGHCRVASAGKFYDVGPGDCIATGMGWHHDVLSVKDGEVVRAVWFEGALKGLRRSGHLWEPKHGKAVPVLGRT